MDSSSLFEQLQELRRTSLCQRTHPLHWRLAQLRSILRLLHERLNEICHALHLDLRKSSLESYYMEISNVKRSCKFAIKRLKKWTAPTKVRTPIGPLFPSSASIVAEPYGLVLVISTWNFPLLLSLQPLIGAIAAGNAVALKTSEIAPATSVLLARLIPMYLDTEAIKVFEGGIPECSLLLEQKWDKIFFTGNGQVGRIVMSSAAKHLTPVTLELGGKCPLLVDSTADLRVAVKRIVMGKWGCNNGQACIAVDYVLAEESIAEKLIAHMQATIEHFYSDDPSGSPDLPRIINERQFSRLERLLDDPLVAGKIVHGGGRNSSDLYIQPTIVVDPPAESLIMTEEIFGPLLPILKVKSMEMAMDFVHQRPRPLAVYAFTDDKKLRRGAMKISCGGLVFNDTSLHFIHEGLPFGGVGDSGMGAYHGKFSFEEFSHRKAVLKRRWWPDFWMRYPPFTSLKQRLLKRVLDEDYVGLACGLCSKSFNKEQT